MGGYVVRLRDGRRFLADEPYHSLTPLQPSKHRLYAWEEAPAVSNRGIRQRLQVAYYLNLY
jgi:hypothetical protein